MKKKRHGKRFIANGTDIREPKIPRRISKSKFEKSCSYCNYVWVAQKKEVKQCPRCKRYFLKNTTGELLK